MTEIYRPDFEAEDKAAYWQEALANAERQVAYAKRVLGVIALEASSKAAVHE